MRLIQNNYGSVFAFQVLRRDLIHAMQKKRPGMLQTAILHHDNAPSHRAAQTTETIKRLGFELLDHPPYSPDLALCDFFLFPLIKRVLRGRRFEDVADLPVAVQQAIAEIPVISYRECFLSWVKRCRKCVGYKGRYFEREYHCSVRQCAY